jgi:mRNA-degrading endonuclease toxin of MazEF toxin-antitoxin module
MVPKQGEVYWAFRDKKRPVVVVSREELNRGRYVLISPLTTARLDVRRGLPNCVYLEGRKYSLKDCVVQTELLTHLPVEDLEIDGGPISTLDGELVREIVRAVGFVMAAECEPS